MKNILFYILLFFFINQDKDIVKVTIEVYSPSTDDTTKIFIAGNNTKMGNWQPDKVRLNSMGNHLWRKSFRYKKGTTLEYKITQGSWDNEAADAKGRPLQNSVLIVKNNTTARSNIYFWKSGDNFEVEGQITGEVRYHKKLEL